MRKGFTLIELLIALAGGVLVFSGILYLFSITRDTALQGSIRAELIQNNRIALERIARDLRQAEELVTSLPDSDSNPERRPANELEFQDGHDPETLTYIRYYLDGQYLHRETSFYSFDSYPNTRVEFNSWDEWGRPPTKRDLDDQIVAEGFANIEFFGEGLITTRTTLQNENVIMIVPTTIFARNLSGT